ncbi:MAG: hypothetical protein ABR553_02500 [Gammaproteobacteria bacterium]
MIKLALIGGLLGVLSFSGIGIFTAIIGTALALLGLAVTLQVLTVIVERLGRWDMRMNPVLSRQQPRRRPLS